MKIQQIGLLLMAGLATQGIQSLGDVAEFKRLSQLEEEEEQAARRKMPTGLPKTGEGTVTENPYEHKRVVFHRSVSEPPQPRQSIHFDVTPSPAPSETPSPTPQPKSPLTPTKFEGGQPERVTSAQLHEAKQNLDTARTEHKAAIEHEINNPGKEASARTEVAYNKTIEAKKKYATLVNTGKGEVAAHQYGSMPEAMKKLTPGSGGTVEQIAHHRGEVKKVLKRINQSGEFTSKKGH